MNRNRWDRPSWHSASALLLCLALGGCGGALEEGSQAGIVEEASVPKAEGLLTLTTTGPAEVFIGRKIRYTNTVTNVGSGAAEGVVLLEAPPQGVEVLSVGEGSALADGSLRWDLGHLPPGESRTVELTIRATSEGEVTRSIEVQDVRGLGVSARSTTKVGGIPAILLEVVDLEDPVEVGQTTTYVITVTNQGSGSDTGIVVECTLPPNTSLVSSQGATATMEPGSVSGRTITFPALERLAPAAEVSYRVTVRADSPADARFRVVMRSDSLMREGVAETEATNFYE